jgi:hypothetical protein
MKCHRRLIREGDTAVGAMHPLLFLEHLE